MSVVIVSKIIKRHISFGLKLMPFIRHTSIYDCLDHPFVAEIEIVCYIIFVREPIIKLTNLRRLFICTQGSQFFS